MTDCNRFTSRGFLPCATMAVLMLPLTISLLTSCRERGSAESRPALASDAAEAATLQPSQGESLPAAIPPPETMPARSSAGTPPPPQPWREAAPPQPSSTAMDLDALTQAVRRYSAEKRRVPSSLNEVVAAGYVKILPPPPPGMRYAIHPTRLEVQLVRQ